MDRNEAMEQLRQYLERRCPDRRKPVDYCSDVRQFAAACSKPWRAVTMHDIDAFVDRQGQAELRPTTINRRVAALKTFLDFLAEDSGDLARPNPVRFKRHAGKRGRQLPRDLSDARVEQLWQQITAPRDRAWFVLMWRGGLRVGEVYRERARISFPCSIHNASILSGAASFRCAVEGCGLLCPALRILRLRGGNSTATPLRMLR